MEIRSNDDGTCYIQDCVGEGTWLVVDLQMAMLGIHGSQQVLWDVMMCEDHAYIVGFKKEGIPIAPNIVLIEEES